MATDPSFFRAARDAAPPPAGIPGITPEDYLVLGLSREDDLVCLHLPTNAVHLIEPQGRMEVSLVNSSLTLFLQCVELVRKALPFRGGPLDAVADAMEADLHAIDPAALAPDGFWECFLSDVANGSYGGT